MKTKMPVPQRRLKKKNLLFRFGLMVSVWPNGRVS